MRLAARLQRIVLTVVLSLAMAARAHPAMAGWSSLPNANVPVSAVAGKQQHPKLVRDALGGTIICWEDGRAGEVNGFGTVLSDIYAQRLLPTGEIASGWTSGGTPVCVMGGDQSYASMLADDAGGAFIVWSDSRPSSPGVYLLRLTVTGQPAAGWPASGLRVSSPSGGLAAICSDGGGGVLVSWGTYFDVRAQHVSASGTRLWDSTGVVVGGPTLTGATSGVAMCSDGAGGAMLAWYRFWGGGNVGLFTQHFTAAGAVAAGWPAQGDSLMTSSTGMGLPPLMLSDGTGGGIIVFQGFPAGGYALRITGTGNLAAGWPPQGRRFTTNGGPSNSMSAVADGAGGIYVGYSASSAYLARLGADSQPVSGWPEGGVLLGNGSYIPGLAQCPGGGVIAAWITWGDYGVMAQRFTAAGGIAPGWPSNGVTLATAVLGVIDYFSTPVAPDGGGGLVAAWMDNRTLTPDVLDIYSQRVGGNGLLGPEPQITRLADVPLDQGGRVLLEWVASYLDCAPTYGISQYSIWRQIPMLPQSATDDPGRYYVTSAEGGERYWEYLASTPARALPGYAFAAPTTTDSVGGANPTTRFMVMSESTGGFPNWPSWPDSGHSVDNLPPSMPSQFLGNWMAQTGTMLSWGANSENDLSGYRLYRGSSPGFVPGLHNHIASQSTEGYTDVGASPAYYKLSAIDIHGNEGGYASLMPGGTVDANELTLLKFALDGVHPNPARGTRFVVRFTLPAGSPARLELLDVAGRHVARREVGSLGSGRHSIDLCRGARLVPGLYLLRLTQGPSVRVKRVAVIE